MASCIAICLIIILSANAISPATSSYFKNQYFPVRYNYDLFTAPVLVNCTLPGQTVTELSDVDFIVAARGDTINVSLAETDPHLNWEYAGGDGVQYPGNSLIETYPVRHLFKLKVNSSGTVRFKMIDDRDGRVVKAFDVNLVVAPPLSGLGWPAISPCIAPSFGWPPRSKF